jgi:hypothetical protein
MNEGKRTRLWIVFGAAVVFWSVVAYSWTQRGKPAPAVVAAPVDAGPAGRIQVALLLDTSSSMDGLIDQARSQLWKVVSGLDQARRSGRRPRLEIAVYEYGNTARTTPDTGWIRQVLPFSDNLDVVSESLFALSTSGGDEYVGQVLQTATRDLAWSGAASDVKMIFVAGNESFEQGPVPPAGAIAAARARGIAVNVILCGGQDPTWTTGARLAMTDLLVIDQNAAPVHVASPQDAEIQRLGMALNDTYIGYGAEGASGVERQRQQDANSKSAQAGSFMWRSMAKSKASYRNEAWDLGDAVSGKKVALEKLEAKQLPEAMRGMSVDERKAYVQRQLDERARLQRRIRELGAERDAFVAKARVESGKSGAASSLDLAMLKAARHEASAAGLTFE